MPLSRLPRTPANRGFTLIEIIVAILFLSIGIMGVVALFILGAKSSAESLRMTRAAVIADDVQNAMANALKYPIDRIVAGVSERIYRFELPHGMSIENDPLTEEEPADDLLQINGFYFKIDANLLPYSAATTEAERNKEVLDLPEDALLKSGGQIGGAARIVWWYRHPEWMQFIRGTGFDEDESRRYSFRLELKRSVIVPSLGVPSVGDLFICTVFVYKSFIEQFSGASLGLLNTVAEPANRPVHQQDFYVIAF